MSKTISIPLKADYALGSTTLARCWKATRKDGFVLAVTTCARDLLFEGVLYRAAEGFIPKAISQEASAAVANTEVEGFLSDDITELEFEAGLWDGATVEVFEVNYRALVNGKLWIATATMGDIKVTRSAFNAELRGLAQKLQKVVGRVVTKGCPWVFGSMSPNAWTAACNKDLGPLTVTGTLTSVTDLRTFADSDRFEVDDWFGAGVITFLTGANAGEWLEVYSYAQSGGAFVTHLPFLNNLAVGDSYSLTPGCRKRYTEDCRTKHANTNNFGGFDLVPGADSVLGLGGTEGTNL
ncbi:DUF2163 domain-containing protein [Variovorax soli]|uniref:DUF2163 domain-containing protein n=1 Tax=Variovorax soli TaxID=376815 RepID=UPI0008397CE5|nr:DUF2163 domain-containing protein [Variovorax soli]